MIDRASKEAEDLSHLIEKYKSNVEQLKILVKSEEQTILDLKKQIKVRDEIIEQKEDRIFEEKSKIKNLEKQLLLMKENADELEQRVEPLMTEIQDNKKVIEEVSFVVYYLFYEVLANIMTASFDLIKILTDGIRVERPNSRKKANAPPHL